MNQNPAAYYQKAWDETATLAYVDSLFQTSKMTLSLCIFVTSVFLYFHWTF